MKIALINENSQCGKNNLIFETLKKVCEPKGHQVFNYGRFAEDDGYQRSYVQAGLLAGIFYYFKKAKADDEDDFDDDLDDIFENESFDLDNDLKPVSDRGYVPLTPKTDSEEDTDSDEDHSSDNSTEADITENADTSSEGNETENADPDKEE